MRQPLRLRQLAILLALLMRAALAAAQAAPLSERLVPLPEAPVAGRPLVRRALGCFSARPGSVYLTDSSALGTQVGTALHLGRPGWLQTVSFQVAACSFDMLVLGVRVYATGPDGYPLGASLLPGVAVRLGRQQLRQRVVLDLSAYQLWLRGDVVLALELLRPPATPGTLLWAFERGAGRLYKLEPPGPSATPNVPPPWLHPHPVRWHRGPASPWGIYSEGSASIGATFLQQAR